MKLPAPPERIEIVPLGRMEGSEALLDWLAEALERWLETPVTVGEPLEVPPEWRRPETGQVESGRVVDALIDRDEPVGERPPRRWCLAVTEADLIADTGSCVYGEAALGGAWAVIGLARLRADLRSPEPEDQLRRRVLKEAVHELGHVAGLEEHCDRPDCVMFASQAIEDTDYKTASFCPACRLRLDSGSFRD